MIVLVIPRLQVTARRADTHTMDGEDWNRELGAAVARARAQLDLEAALAASVAEELGPAGEAFRRRRLAVGSELVEREEVRPLDG